MATAMVVPRGDWTDALTRRWARPLSTDQCPRCSGFMVTQWCEGLQDNAGQRCVQCGELIDPVILRNRRLQLTGALGSGEVIGSARVRRKELAPWTGWVAFIFCFIPIVLLLALVVMDRLDRRGDQGREQETWTGYSS
jgi:hypothetical protein